MKREDLDYFFVVFISVNMALIFLKMPMKIDISNVFLGTVLIALATVGSKHVVHDIYTIFKKICGKFKAKSS